jgi:hypothetical protein
MKFIIFKRNGEQIGYKLDSYESDFKDDTSANRSHELAEPKAIHIQLPDGLDEDCVKPQWMELEATYVVTLREPVEAQTEKWTKEGEEDLFEQPMVEIDGELIPDHSWNHISALEAKEGLYQTIPSIFGWGLIEDTDKKLAKRQAIANAKLNAIRALREPLLIAADHLINAAEDDGQIATNIRAYRKALRECTDDLKKVNGDAKLSCENLIPEEFEFPSKP